MKKIRYLYTKAIATSDFKQHYGKNWRKIIKKTIQNSSEIFENEFGIKLLLKKVRVRNYEPRTVIPHYVFDYIGCLSNKDDLNKFDIIIAFTNAPFFYHGSRELYGVSEALAATMYNQKSAFILLVNPEKTKNWSIYCNEWKYLENLDSSFLRLLLTHELGHPFGAKDVKNKKSYMTKFMTTEACFFNRANKRIIFKNKWKKLDKSAS